MSAFVIKSWSAADQADAAGNYVDIQGRAGGFLSWLLNLAGISPTVRLMVRADKIIFQKGSLREGTMNLLIPLENVCSTFYGYKKPLAEAVVLGILVGVATFFLMGIPGIIAGVVYYLFNKSLTIGLTDIGGRMSAVPFKRSVIEGHILDEAAANRVADIIQHLVDARRQSASASLAISRV